MLALLLIVFIAYAVQAAIGFAGGLIALSFGVMILPFGDVQAIVVPIGTLLSFTLLAKYWRNVDRNEVVRWILPWMSVAMIVGFVLYEFLDPTALKKILGFVVATAASWRLYVVLVRDRKRALDIAHATAAVASATVDSSFALVGNPHLAAFAPVNPLAARARARRVRQARARRLASEPIAGAEKAAWICVAGVVHGLFGTGGPPLVYVLSRTNIDKTAFRATLAAVWTVLNTIFVTKFALRGDLNETHLPYIALGIPVLGLAFVCGEWMHKRLEEEKFRVIVQCLLLVAGVALVVR